MEHQKEDISIKMEDNNGDDNADDYVVDTGMESGSEAPPAQLYPWPTLDLFVFSKKKILNIGQIYYF
jgi:hypothetical protein